MNEIFDSKRFGKYFVTDLKNNWNNFGISFIILCTVPVVLTLIVGLWGIILSGHHWVSVPIGVRLGFWGLSYFITLLSMSPKVYGFITDKKRGSSFLMIPVSSFEKTLSMLLSTILVGIILFMGLYLFFDIVICWIDKGCGQPLLTSIIQLSDKSIEELGIQSVKSILVWTSITQAIFTFFGFLFGAVFFKKSKSAKTILSIIVISIFIGMFASIIIPNINWDFNFDENDALTLMKTFSYGGIIINSLCAIGMATAVYFRVKTLKH